MRLVNAAYVVKEILKERDKIPLTLPPAPYEFGEQPNHFGQALRGGIRKALRCVEEAPTIDAVPRSEYEQLVAKCHQLERERDAAVGELEILQACEDCRWYNLATYRCEDVAHEVCNAFESHWEWRGVQDE